MIDHILSAPDFDDVLSGSSRPMVSPQKYTSRRIEVHAVQWDGTIRTACAINAWSHGIVYPTTVGGPFLEIATTEGTLRAITGDWIVCGASGNFYPCKAEVFAERFEC